MADGASKTTKTRSQEDEKTIKAYKDGKKKSIEQAPLPTYSLTPQTRPQRNVEDGTPSSVSITRQRGAGIFVCSCAPRSLTATATADGGHVVVASQRRLADKPPLGAHQSKGFRVTIASLLRQLTGSRCSVNFPIRDIRCPHLAISSGEQRETPGQLSPTARASAL